MMLAAEGLLEALPERMLKKSPTPSQRRDQNRAECMARYEECRRLKQLGLSNREIAPNRYVSRDGAEVRLRGNFPGASGLSAAQSDDGALF
jgi:hypothetical protein